MFQIARVPSDPRRELPRDRVRAIAEAGEFEVVPAAGGGVDGELVLEDKAAPSDDVVDGDEALDGDGGVVCALEAVHQGFDDCGSGGAGAVADRQEGGDMLFIGRNRELVSGGSEKGESGRLGEKSCFTQGSLVLDRSNKLSQFCASPHYRHTDVQLLLPPFSVLVKKALSISQLGQFFTLSPLDSIFVIIINFLLH